MEGGIICCMGRFVVGVVDRARRALQGFDLLHGEEHLL